MFTPSLSLPLFFSLSLSFSNTNAEGGESLGGAHHTHLTESALLARRSHMIYQDDPFVCACGVSVRACLIHALEYTHTHKYTHTDTHSVPLLALQLALETLMVTYMELMQTEAF